MGENIGPTEGTAHATVVDYFAVATFMQRIPHIHSYRDLKK